MSTVLQPSRGKRFPLLHKRPSPHDVYGARNLLSQQRMLGRRQINSRSPPRPASETAFAPEQEQGVALPPPTRGAHSPKGHRVDTARARSRGAAAHTASCAAADASLFSGAHQAVDQRPRQHEGAQPFEQAARPHLAAWLVEEALGLGARAHREDERRRHERAAQVEDESGVRLEAQGAGGNAEERGGEVADVGDGLCPVLVRH